MLEKLAKQTAVYGISTIAVRFLSYLLTPATVCLAVPLYEKLSLLKSNWKAIFAGILSGVITTLCSVFVMSKLFHLTHEEYVTLLPKSITTAIGMDVAETLGGTAALAGAVIILTGLLIPEGIKNAQISNVFPLMYGALAIFAFAFIVIALTNIPETQKTEGKKVAETSKYSPLSFRHFILGSVAIFVYVGVEVGVPNVLQKWLQNPELNVLGSGVNATYWLLMLVGRLLGAMIGSKVSAKSMLMVVSSAGLLLTLGAMFAPNVPVNLPVFNGAEGFGLVNVPVSAALLVLVGLCTSVMWGGIFNLAVEGLGKYTEKASGIFMALVCGGGILPLLQNGIVDLTGGVGYLTSYWVIVAGLAYMLYYALIGSKNVNKDIPVEE